MNCLELLAIWVLPVCRQLVLISILIYPKWFIDFFPLVLDSGSDYLLRGALAAHVNYTMLEHILAGVLIQGSTFVWYYVLAYLAGEMALLVYLVHFHIVEVRGNDPEFTAVVFTAVTIPLLIKTIYLTYARRILRNRKVATPQVSRRRLGGYFQQPWESDA